MKRVSFLEMNELCQALNYKIVKEQSPGANKKRIYSYKVYENKKLLVESKSLKNILEKVLNIYSKKGCI